MAKHTHIPRTLDPTAFTRRVAKGMESSHTWRHSRFTLWRGFISWLLANLQEDETAIRDAEARAPGARPEWEAWAEAYQQAVAAAPFDDLLGSAYMQLGQGRPEFAQYFTPPTVAGLMTAMLGSPHEAPEEGMLFRAMEPCCGSGVMILAAAGQHQAHGAKPWIWCGIDLDRHCCEMAALQCFLNDIPAVILCGNSLTWSVAKGAAVVSPRIQVQDSSGRLERLERIHTERQLGLILDNLERETLEALQKREALRIMAPSA